MRPRYPSARTVSEGTFAWRKISRTVATSVGRDDCGKKKGEKNGSPAIFQSKKPPTTEEMITPTVARTNEGRMTDSEIRGPDVNHRFKQKRRDNEADEEPSRWTCESAGRKIDFIWMTDSLEARNSEERKSRQRGQTNPENDQHQSVWNLCPQRDQ